MTVDAKSLDFAHVHRNPGHDVGIDAVLLFTHQGFAREFEKDSLVDGRIGGVG
jgi:hypothetical protein